MSGPHDDVEKENARLDEGRKIVVTARLDVDDDCQATMAFLKPIRFLSL